MSRVIADAGTLDAKSRPRADAGAPPEARGDLARRPGTDLEPRATLAWRSTKLVSTGDGDVAILLLADGTVVRRSWSLQAWRDGRRLWKLDKDAEKTASFNLAAAVTRPLAGAPPPAPEPKKDDKDKGKKEERADTKEFRAFVIADVDAFSDLVMSNVPGNQALFADSARWLLGEEKWIGATNSEEDVRIEHTKQQDLAWFYTTIIGVPCLVLGAGVYLGRRSQRRRGGKS